MNANTKIFSCIFILMMAFAVSAAAQSNTVAKKEPVMKTFLIERDIPGAGNLTPADLKGISQKSCTVLKQMNGIQWVQSYVTGNKIFCVYRAENETLLREHAKKGGFPITNIIEINNTISPATAEN
ncbi:DUF4242 domain-containing protein [Lacibacter sp. MH-610]|uniref:DUF4242 domain-containing protein n=1 Tax=Lacibacter sp. MH-610 TaxID=3020883 RepID=UPI0038912BD8